MLPTTFVRRGSVGPAPRVGGGRTRPAPADRHGRGLAGSSTGPSVRDIVSPTTGRRMEPTMTVERRTIPCPSCEASVPADARFCMSCGNAMTPAVDADRGATRAASRPRHRRRSWRRCATAKLSGERKPVTALFVDVVGSTAHLERMDPEDWTSIINEAFDLMSAAVYRYEGTIAQLQGDAMLAFFGAPVAHEDDPERAILAALDMVARDRGVRAPAQGGARRRLRDPRRHQHRAGRGRQRRQRPALRVHRAGRRGQRRGAAPGRRRSRASVLDRRDDPAPRGRGVRDRRPRRRSR